MQFNRRAKAVLQPIESNGSLARKACSGQFRCCKCKNKLKVLAMSAEMINFVAETNLKPFKPTKQSWQTIAWR